MMHQKKARLLLTVTALFFLAVAPVWSGGKAEPAQDPVAGFLDKADTTFAYDTALRLTDPGLFNSELGGRQSGSEAEHRTADLLVTMMEEVGLKNIRKEAFPVDTWQFNGSTLTVLDPAGESKVIKPYAYASGGTSPEGITAELLYVNEGTMFDYEDLDVSGKIVLIDIDMYNYWWIEYPTLEAELNGAAAIINNCVGGYAMLNDNSMNTQDFVGPISIPSVNISRNDTAYLKGLLEKGTVTINLKVDNIVKEGGTSYNIIGEIPGKTDEMIILGDHYDTHFWGFQDNSTAVAMALTIAKGLIDSGYQPQRTFVFVLHGAEEWGAIDTRYDWAIGAWNQVNTVNPDWSGKALAFFNFEHPAHFILDEAYYVNSTPELNSLIDRFNAEAAPDLTWKYPEGYSKEHYHISTWTDSYPYNQSGIPATCNARSTKTQPRSEDFGALYYHSNFDDPSTWEEDVFRTNLHYYGTLAIELDKSPVLELDFTAQADRLTDSLDTEVFAAAGVDAAMLESNIEAFRTAGARVYSQLSTLNDLYKSLAAQKTPAKLMQEIRDAGYAANRQTLKAFRKIQDDLYRLNWGDGTIFEHQHAQGNIALLSEAIEKLKAGEVDYVVDEILWDIELHWYSYYFSKENVQYHMDQVFSPDNRDNLFWGTGRVVAVMDLWDTVQSLNAKYGSSGADLSVEIADLEKNLEEQKVLLSEAVYAETSVLPEITAMLDEVDLSEVIANAQKAVK
ncbi:MAG: M28 family peptidase [Spirochaetales bacterium]|nr:M28 family peptidase [Spirochaetales bacterium]